MGHFFKDIWRSATDLKFYQEVARLPLRNAFRHLLKVVALFGTIGAIVLVSQIIFLNQVWRWCGDNLPVIVIRNGEATAEVAQPYRVERKLAGRELCAVVIDTTGQVARLDPKYRLGILVKKRSLVVTMGEGSVQWSFAGVRDLTIDRDYFVRRRVSAGWCVLYVAGLYAVFLALLTAQSAAVALLGQGVSAFRGSGCTFPAVLKMSFYAVSLSVCALFIILVLGIRLMPFYLVAIYLLIHVAFLMGAMLARGGDVAGE